MNRSRSVWMGAAGAFIAASSYLALPAGVTVDETIHTPVRVRGNLTSQACSNNPGPYITLSGEIGLGAIDAVLIFRNNARGTHQREEGISVRVSLAAGQVIQFNKQPPLGGVGGNPFIFLQICDGNWNPLSDKILLGRCVQGLLPFNVNFGHFADVLAQIAGSCSNNPGPFITLDGAVTFGGINARVTFQNSPHANAPHQRSEAVNLDIELLRGGNVIRFAKQPPLGGVGGNPHIYVKFECNGESSDEVYLGRCVQLSNG